MRKLARDHERPHLDVPDPRLAVLRAMPDRFRATMLQPWTLGQHRRRPPRGRVAQMLIIAVAFWSGSASSSLVRLARRGARAPSADPARGRARRNRTMRPPRWSRLRPPRCSLAACGGGEPRARRAAAAAAVPAARAGARDVAAHDRDAGRPRRAGRRAARGRRGRPDVRAGRGRDRRRASRSSTRASGAVAGASRCPAPARHLSLARPGGPFLVPLERRRRARRGPAAGPLRLTRAGGHPHDATAAGDEIYVGDEFGGTLSVLRDGELRPPGRGRRPARRRRGRRRLRGGRLGARVHGRVDPADDSRGSAPRTRATGRRTWSPTRAGRLYVADTRGGGISVFETRPRLKLRRARRAARLAVRAGGRRRARRLWVTLTARNQLAEVSLGGGRAAAHAADGAPAEQRRGRPARRPRARRLAQRRHAAADRP